MTNPVIKGASYCLIHAPDMVLTNGTTITMERAKHPESQFLKDVQEQLRSYEDALAYPPNQCYIGNITPEELGSIPQPWYEHPLEPNRTGTFGEIFPLDEFIALMKISDSFNLVFLETTFANQTAEKLTNHPLFSKEELAIVRQGHTNEQITKLLNSEMAVPLKYNGEVVGCIKQAHESDANLSANVIFENLVAKASASLGLKRLIWQTKIDPAEIDYIIETSEEACGDMNQRGGGNFAKAIGEVCGCVSATGSDTRSFCAGPAHGIINAAALVKSGIYKNVVVVGGGASAKLGMNSRDHVKKNVPVLEDMLGTFAILISENDNRSPIIRTDAVGRHTIGTGSSPQAVTTSLVTDPLKEAGLSIKDIDKYSVEMQNPEITVPAGAGDVPLANFKMIAALGVKQGVLERSELNDFVVKHGMKGWAPTQGHIPSGVPYIGFARKAILKGEMKRAMIIGKGSLFLARMTNLFDGISFIIEPNPGTNDDRTSPRERRRTWNIGITLQGSEHGMEEVLRGAELAQKISTDIRVLCIGPKNNSDLETIEAATEEEQRTTMERLLATGQLDACVTMHYNFPLGVTTIGRVCAPGTGSEMLIASTTGMAAANRIDAMIKNAILGISTAKALGISKPTVGILNVDGARAAERALLDLQVSGYEIHWAESIREGGGLIMRGNDILRGACQVLVTDSLTGNILVKMLSSLTTGGNYETLGYGYGPGVGEDYDKIVCIISRASGAPVIANAIEYAASMAKANLHGIVQSELTRAARSGLVLSSSQTEDLSPPPKPVDEEISGIDVLEIEEAAQLLWKSGIYAETGMGCTGPVVLVANEDALEARKLLLDKGFIL